MTELDRCRSWIEAALEYSGGTHDFADIVGGVVEGRMQLWAGDKACAITEIIVYPKKKVLHTFLAGGDKEQIRDMQDSAMAWGKQQGCTAMSIAGRRGWLRELRPDGWKEQFTTLQRAIP